MEGLISGMQLLGIDDKLGQWIELKSSNSLLTNAFEASEHEIRVKDCKLHEIQAELNDKCFSILDTIFDKILKNLPGYDPKVFQRLKIFNRQVNAKIRQTHRKLSAYQEPMNENPMNVSSGQIPEDNFDFQCSPIKEINTADFIDPKFSPPQSRSTASSAFQLKRPLSACLGPKIIENSKFPEKKSMPTSTVTSTSVAPTRSDDNALNDDEDGLLLDMDMQSFLKAYGDDSEEFFSTNVGNKPRQQSQDFLAEFPEFNAGENVNRQTTENLLESNNCKDSMVQLIGGVKNDGENREFNTLDHSHCRQMLHIFRSIFGLHLFRPNQLSAINAAILGHDCFVLMPTGGGKSLCYQLPALLVGGVTIVISPLRSLILDQTQKLLSLDIPAMYLTGDQTDYEQTVVYKKLREANCEVRLLYVTPEKISCSTKFMDTLNFLYQCKKLTRFVIDEVHCVSQWGHDFRPDYKKLSMLRQRFPGVPLMALTATATQRVRSDILHQLNVQSPKWFISSFNRPNLRYSVIPKKAKTSGNQITEIIKEKFANDCGIIYCISRKDCDNLAHTLSTNGLKALSYHAGLPDKVRIERQSQWISEKVKIIVATIAFGMGIDKPNVRFVIHGAMPKSIEGYYQESGRAGRDGEPADCILLYNYGDVYRYRNLFERSENINPEALKTHLENLNRMVHFCDNLADCRRALQLNYFGEQFDRQDCIANEDTMCDNCKTYDQFVEIDVTEHAVNLVKLIQTLARNSVTMLQVVDIYKGSDVSQIAYKLCSDYRQWYGAGNSLTKYEIERLLHILVVNNYLCENMEPNNGIVCAYLAPGRLVNELIHGNDVQICLQKKAVKKPTTAVATKQTTLSPQMSVVTNVALKDIEQRCYEELMDMVNGIAGALDVSANSIMNMVALRKMSQDLPTTQMAMMKIPHVTKANFEKYGKSLLDITQKYAKEKAQLLEDEGVIQNAFIDFDESEDEIPTNLNNNGKRNNRGNGGRAKRIKQNYSDRNNDQSIAGTTSSYAAGRNFGNGTNSYFSTGKKKKPTFTKRRNYRGRGASNFGGYRGPGLLDLSKKDVLDIK